MPVLPLLLTLGLVLGQTVGTGQALPSCCRAGSAAVRVVTLAAGGYAGYALLASGAVMAWGDDLEGQLGDGDAGTVKTVPVRVVGLPAVIDVAGGGNSAFAVTQGGTLWGWGDNSEGQLGRSGLLESPAPVRISHAGMVTSVTAGAFSVYALREDATAWAWGDNSFGQLGEGPARPTVTGSPQRGGLVKLRHVVSVVAGAADAYALDAAGNVWAFGDNTLGQLGQGTASGQGISPRPRFSVVPIRVRGLERVVQIAAGGDTCYALKKDGTVWAWGDDGFGEIGDGTRRLYVDRPTRVQGLAQVVSIAAGASTGYALLRDGAVWAWGRGTSHELGDGQASDQSLPVRVGRLNGVTQVAASGEFALALSRDGTVWAWGNNTYGQLGDGSVTGSNMPVRVAGL
jgi:alpha-tubulin suppressor-like RCC1 family protein